MSELGKEAKAAEGLYQRVEEPIDVMAGMVGAAIGKVADQAVEKIAQKIQRKVRAAPAGKRKAKAAGPAALRQAGIQRAAGAMAGAKS